MESLEERVAKLEAKVSMILSDLEFIKNRLDTIENRILELASKRDNSRLERLLRVMLFMYLATLSFLAAVLGVSWHW